MYDGIVIGAGHNGLVAANLLADAGWSVLVLEANDHVGGAVHSDRSVHPDYVTDLYSAFYPLGAASPVLKALRLEEHGLTWSHAPAVLAHVLPDDRCAVLGRQPETTAASLDGFHPGDGEAWLEQLRSFESVCEPLLDALFRPFPPVVPALKLLRRLDLGGTLRFARFALTPVRRFGDETFGGEGGPLLFAGNALHTDLPPEGAGSAIYGWLLAMLGQTYGFPVPVGGAAELALALSRRVEGRAEVRLGTRVAGVVVRDGRAVGVRLADGTEVGVRRAVLADVSAPALFRDMVGEDHLPARFVTDLNSFQWDSPTLKVDWALSERIPWTAEGAHGAGTVHLGVDLDGLSRYATSLATKTIPQQPFLLFGQMTTADPTRSPDGTESAWAYTHLPENLPLTAADVEQHVQRVEQTIERHAPGFRRLVVGRRVQSPSDLESSDANLHRGAVNGGTASLHQQLVWRPVPGLGRPETPVRGLYLASASAHPGGGVHGGPGHNAAVAALHDGPVTRTVLRTLSRRLYRTD